MAFFRYKTSALRKGVEVGQNTIAPRERAYQNTSRRTGPEVDNARRPGFAGAKMDVLGRFAPFWGAFGATRIAITRKLLGRCSPYFVRGRGDIRDKLSRTVSTPDVSGGLRKSIFKPKKGLFSHFLK